MLLAFQSAGTILKVATHIPPPGPLIGMLLLALRLLLARKPPNEILQNTADGLLSWLGLFFVPASVGVMANLALLRAAWGPLTVALAGSTLLTLVITSGIMTLLQSRQKGRRPA